MIIIIHLDTVRELLSRVPANAKSELPASAAHTIAPELVGEYDLTPLHLAAYSGSEDVVRVLLNSSGVDVEGGCTPAVSQCFNNFPNIFIRLSFSFLNSNIGL